MREKQQILEDANRDITNERYKADAPLWLQLRQLEVCIDIRDILNAKNEQIASAQATILNNL